MTTFKQFLESQEPNTFFHVTTPENYEIIKKQGLKPQMGTRSEKLESEPAIFMFKDKDSMEDALNNWLLDQFDEDQELIVLKVNLPPEFPYHVQGSEVSTTQSIPPQFIQKTNIQI